MSEKILVSLTTLPGRYPVVEKAIDSLKQQTLQPDAIYLTIPKKAIRLDLEYPEPPSTLQSKCQIVRIDTDYGPLTKIYGGLLKSSSPNDIIITVDDDVEFEPTYIEKLVEKARKHPTEAICATGALIGRGLYSISIYSSINVFKATNFISGFVVPNNGRLVDIAYGVGGVAYRRFFFPDQPEKLMNISSISSALFHNDDVLISGWLSRVGVKRRLFSDLPTVKGLGNDSGDALSMGLFRLISRMNEAIDDAKKLGMYQQFEAMEATDPVSAKVAILILIIIVIVIFGWLYLQTILRR